MGELSFTEGDLDSLATRGTLAVLSREILADLLTPVAVFCKTVASHDHAFLLESVQGGEFLARYSFLGGGPRRVFRFADGKTKVKTPDGLERELSSDLIADLREARDGTVPVPMPDLP